MSLPEMSDLPPESVTPVTTHERRFEELAILQVMLAERDGRLAGLEDELELLRRTSSGAPSAQVQAQIDKAALGADIERLQGALEEKERARFALEEDLRALTDDHYRISHDLEALQDPSARLDSALAAPSRADLILEIKGLIQKIDRQQADLDRAAAKLDRARLSEVFEAEGGAADGLAARAERGMRRQQMAMLTSLLADEAGRAKRHG